MVLTIILSVTVLIVSIIYGEIRKWVIQRRLKGFAQPKQLPILGVAGRFINKTNDQYIDMLNELVDEVGQTPMQAWFGPLLVVLIAEPDDMQTILTSDDCLNKPFFYQLIQAKTSIIATQRDTWKPHRRALNVAFNLKIVQNYAPHLNEKARILAEQFAAHIDDSGDFYRTISIGVIDMLLMTTMGSEQHAQVTAKGPFFNEFAKKIMSNIMYRITRVWLKWDFIYALSSVYREEQPMLGAGIRFIEEIVEQKIAELEQLHAKGVDHLADAEMKNTTNLLEKCLILERNGTFTRVNTMDQMLLLIFGGIGTSSITIYATLLMLAMHQDCQAAVLAELRTFFHAADSDVTYEDLPNLEYLERCIRETLRLFPPGPVIARLTTADIQLPSGTIPKGTTVVLDIMHLHRDPKIWGNNVGAFDPDRFLPENIAKRPPFSYIPFSAGQRNCIAMKYGLATVKITLAHLLRRYQFKSSLKMEEIRLKAHITLQIMNENPFTLEKRVF